MYSSEINELVVYRKRREATLGIVLSLDGDRVGLLSEDGKRYEIEAKKLVLTTSMRISGNLTDSERKLEMRKWRKKLEEEKASVDVKTLWECVVGEKETASFAELLDLYSGESETPDAERLSFFWAVDKNAVYLTRTEDGYAVRSRQEVSATLRASRLREEREKRLEAAVRWSKAVVSGEVPAEIDENHAEFLELAERYLVDPDGYDRAKEAKRFLHDVGLDETESAVEFLIKTGYWEKDDDRESKRISLHFGYSEREIRETEAVLSAEDDFGDLSDRTDLEVFSVDSETTADIDDAISLEDRGDRIVLGVHISNVARFVNEGSFLDRGALERAETVYFPEGSTDMFPRKLVNSRLSLAAGALRPALSLFATFEKKDFTPAGYVFEETVVRVSKNLSYEEATGVFGSEPRGKTLSDLTASLRRRRIERGAFIVQLPELKIEPGGGEISIWKDFMNSPAHKVVSECMILMNSLSGDFFSENGIPALFRSQARDIDPEASELDPEDVLFPVKVIKHLKPSSVAAAPQVHKSLGVTSYVQMTSPIRRYTDLLMQRQLVGFLRGEGIRYSDAELEDTNTRVSLGTREIKNAQRSRHRYWLLRYIQQKQIKGATGFVSPRGRDGFNVYIPEFLVELPISNAGSRTFRVGEEVPLAVWGVDPLRRRIRVSPA